MLDIDPNILQHTMPSSHTFFRRSFALLVDIYFPVRLVFSPPVLVIPVFYSPDVVVVPDVTTAGYGFSFQFVWI